VSRLRLGLSVLETSVGGTAASQLADELENTSDARKRRDELTNDSSLPLFYQRLDRLQALLTSQPIVLADPSRSCVLEEGTGEVGFPDANLADENNDLARRERRRDEGS